jgi:chromosome segregation ATPase
MKAIALNIVLIALCLVLGVLLYVQQKRTVEQQSKATATTASLLNLSNELNKAKSQYDQQKGEIEQLETNLTVQADQVMTMSNELVAAAEKLSKVELESKTFAESAREAKEEVARRDTKINDLEGQRDDLTRRMGDLTNSITGLEQQIDATEKKLTASEGDRAFLLKELKRLQTEKSELEKQLNSLAFLREQVKKLREELSVQRRLDWIRRGILSGATMKGAERMQSSLQSKTVASTNYNLNVELRQDGTVRVAPAATNAPSATNAPAPVPAPQK